MSLCSVLDIYSVSRCELLIISVWRALLFVPLLLSSPSLSHFCPAGRLIFLFTEVPCVIPYALVCLAIGQPLCIHYPFYRHALITQFPTSITVLLCIVSTSAARAISISLFSSQSSPPPPRYSFPETPRVRPVGVGVYYQ